MLLPAVAMWIILLVGGNEISAGRMRVDEFFTFAMYVYELTFPTFLLGFVVTLVQRGAASMQRIDELLSEQPAIADRADAVPLRELRGEIEFRRLTFGYAGSGREPALRDIELRVPAGSTLGVVGTIGSGKSTLACVIPRLFEVDDGQLFIDGVDINRIPLRTLRSSIAMVPQDSFLFSMTLADNIAFGLETPDRERIVEAARRAQLAKDVPDLPDGWDTVVGERGVMLSGGQRQRTALARALALRPKILILDDTLSSVDAGTEAAIQRELETVFAGRTVVVVSHRVSSVRAADQIVVLEAGRIAEQGSHDALIERGGLYARLAQEQALEADLVARRLARGGPGMSEPKARAPRGRRRGDARGGSPRQGVRRTAAAAAVALRAALSRPGCAHARARAAHLPARAGARLDREDRARRAGGRGQQSAGCALVRAAGGPAAAALARPALSRGDGRELRALVCRRARDVANRTGRDARPAARRLRPHPEAAPRLLRSLSGRAPRHARDQRRRERERDVRGGDRRARHRSVQDAGLRRGAVPRRRPARLHHVPRRAGPRDRGDRLPSEGSRGFPSRARAHRSHQRVSPGARHRDEGGAALQPRGEELSRVRRHERRPSRRLVHVDPLRRRTVRRGRARLRDHRRDHHLAGDRPGRRRQALRVHRLDAALLPAAARPVGEVLGDAVLDGQRGAHLPAARHAAASLADRGGLESRAAARGWRGRAGWSSSIT